MDLYNREPTQGVLPAFREETGKRLQVTSSPEENQRLTADGGRKSKTPPQIPPPERWPLIIMHGGYGCGRGGRQQALSASSEILIAELQGKDSRMEPAAIICFLTGVPWPCPYGRSSGMEIGKRNWVCTFARAF
ncbi:hypothetical protein IMZ48_20835 [Candidatus Bathyarchaeota archaeon]|nr:hypothetical protein [Candidatus Bathyarchaeota archaeon]